MKNIQYLLFTTALLLPLSQNVVHGQTIVQHLGANDPFSEGFTFNPPDGRLEPVFNDSGFDAWSIDTDLNTSGLYTYLLSDEEQESITTQGWVLSARLRLIEAPEPRGVFLGLFTGTNSHVLTFTMDSNGDPVVDAAFGEYTVTGGEGAYHEFSLVYDVASEMAALWIDGVERISNMGGEIITAQPHLFFGGGELPSHSHWSEVTLVAIPEPAMVAFLAGLGALIVVAGVRLRRRKLNQ